tara:strand:- start:10725 stop:11039 length:315 start_codon:yes stop_codon:yes gene_type:complete
MSMVLQSLQNTAKFLKRKSSDGNVGIVIGLAKRVQGVGVVVEAMVERSNTQQDQAAGHPLLGVDPSSALLGRSTKDIFNAHAIWFKELWMVKVKKRGIRAHLND